MTVILTFLAAFVGGFTGACALMFIVSGFPQFRRWALAWQIKTRPPTPSERVR